MNSNMNPHVPTTSSLPSATFPPAELSETPTSPQLPRVSPQPVSPADGADGATDVDITTAQLERRAAFPDDPLTFIDDYCARYNLPDEAGGSAIERACHNRAEAAREAYKAHVRRTASAVDITPVVPSSPSSNSSTTSAPGGPSSRTIARRRRTRPRLSPAQKYQLRLRNNRRSAHAAKVYAEVLKRELSAVLQRVSPDYLNGMPMPHECVRCDDSLVKKNQAVNDLTIMRLRADVARLTVERDRLTERVTMTENARLAAEQEARETRNGMPWGFVPSERDVVKREMQYLRKR